MPAHQPPSVLNKPFALKRTYRDVCWYSDHVNVIQSRSTEQLSVCLVSFAPSLGTRGRPSGQLQAEEPERKLDEQKERKLQQAFGSHAGSGTVRAHKELTVSVVALRIPAVYSPRHTHRIHTETAHRES